MAKRLVQFWADWVVTTKNTNPINSSLMKSFQQGRLALFFTPGSKSEHRVTLANRFLFFNGIEGLTTTEGAGLGSNPSLAMLVARKRWLVLGPQGMDLNIWVAQR